MSNCRTADGTDEQAGAAAPRPVKLEKVSAEEIAKLPNGIPASIHCKVLHNLWTSRYITTNKPIKLRVCPETATLNNSIAFSGKSSL